MTAAEARAVREGLAFFERLVDVGLRLPPAERASLDRWDREHTGRGGKRTSDWPGWAKYLPPAPWVRGGA
jgi:hypothetical protein